MKINEIIGTELDIWMYIYGFGILGIGILIYLTQQNLILYGDIKKFKKDDREYEWEWDREMGENGYCFHYCNLCGKGIRKEAYCYMDEIYCSERCRKKIME